jgi:methionyl-tRNA formyltransferase
MNIAYCGYDFFAPCMSELEVAGHEIIKLFTWVTDGQYDFNEFVVDFADKRAIEISYERMNLEDLVQLKDSGCDLIITAAYPFKIPRYHDYVPFGINIHPSPLPEGRGPWPLPWTIIKDLRRSSVCFHKLDDKWDRGDILMQQWFDVSPDEDLETLSAKCQLIAKGKIAQVVGSLADLWVNASPQADGSYWQMPKREDRTLNWEWSVEEIQRMVRAYGKFESRAMIEGCWYWIMDTNSWHDAHNHPPGTVVHRTNKEIVVAAKDGYTLLRYWKREQE